MTDKIIERIRKLLALARDKGAFENESAIALAAAQKMMLEHNISSIDEVESEGAIRGRWMGVQRDDKWERIVALATAKLFNCRSVLNGNGDHQFVGRRENIEACEMTFLWICDQVEELYKKGLLTFKQRMGRLGKSDRSEFRKTFKESCALRIFHRVAEIVAQARNAIPDHKALVVIDQSLAQADDLLKGIQEGKKLIVRKTGFGTGAGRAAGDQVKLQHEVKDRNV